MEVNVMIGKRHADVHGLDLHEEIIIDDKTCAMRVPGGWLYTVRPDEYRVAAVFVPFNSEFRKDEVCEPVYDVWDIPILLR
jgi:hypothetical protein